MLAVQHRITHVLLVLVLLALVSLIGMLATGVYGGPLDPAAPPSSPSGVFGSGTPISSLPYTINSPGSYYLTGNLTGVNGQNGITIAANDVTLDLRGFTLQGVPGSGSGVWLQTPQQWRSITIKNGTARGWGGSGFEIQLLHGGVFDSLISEGNGQWGFVIGTGSTITRCAATHNGFSGINVSQSTIIGCTAQFNGGHGFQINGNTTLRDCVAAFNAFQGVDAGSGARVEGCTVQSNDGIGIKVFSADVIGNKVSFNDDDGIEAGGSGGTIEGNTVTRNSFITVGAGIDVSGSKYRVANNHVTDDGTPAQETGISVTGTANVVIGNSATGNMANYGLIGAGGSYGPLASAATATNPFANIDY